MKINKIFLSILICSLIIFTSCKTKQSAIKENYQKGLDVCELINNSVQMQPSFETMNISRMSMTIYYGQYSFTCKSSIRIITDSLINISIQPALGIEMIRMDLTPENFVVYDKLNRKYATGDYEYLRKHWGVYLNYKSIEALFSHKIFTPYSNNPNEYCKAFKIQHNSDTSTIVAETPIPDMYQQFDISMFNYRLTLTGLLFNGFSIGDITYGELKDFDGIRFPEEVFLQTSLFSPSITAKLEINKVTFDKPFNVSAINKRKYKKVTIPELLRFK